ncbi:cell wall metabolism sensor histidine kinase WalK [Paenibacillus sp. PAMC21692]|uniref:sensor histidine kinase n=1 Tax=Paenibacillus sp. PAMC21692 TaxID=2762320 RepID=UPI00164EB320|nr:HAMP domain-containing sensor histidine kinase [Paenibacillus sp. PAMC21692]QNK59892.1 HAMP domain-containing histidine kinase [Paenibacillus sp. PAMC21692]
MFQKTKIRLTLLNATVLFLILTVLGTSLYLYMRTTIIGGIDKALEERSVMWRPVTTISTMPTQGLPFVMAQETKLSLATISSASSVFARNVDILFWNDEGQLLNMNITYSYPPNLLDVLQRSLQKEGLYSISHKGAEYRLLNIRADGGDPEVGYYQYVSDISSEISMLNTIMTLIIVGIIFGGGISIFAGLYLAKRALVPIRSSWEKQQQFMADASHELRTPLAVLQTHTELLLRHPGHTIEEESMEISTMLKEIKRMNKLVNGLLTLAQSDSEGLELQLRPVRLDDLTRGVAKQFLPLAAMKNILLSVYLPEESTISGDEERLQQLLMILLDNAIKYTLHGGKVRASCKKTASGVELKIQDTGPGIPREELPFIFERFYRGDKTRNRTEGGTGLGLSIAQWIVTRHGGKIEADSVLHKGTTIVMTFPDAG